MITALLTFILPILIIVFLNTLSGPPGSNRYENITHTYGWGAAISLLIAMFILPIIRIFWPTPEFETIQNCFSTTYVFCITAVLSRDYEKILKPHAEYLRKKFKWLDNFINK